MFNKDSLWDFTALACLISVILSPIGIFLMWWKTRWTLKGKLFVSGGFGILYAAIIILVIMLTSSGVGGGDSGIGLPAGSTNSEYVMSSDRSSGNGGGKPAKSKSSSSGKSGNSSNQSAENVTAVSKTNSSRAIFSILFFLIIFISVLFLLSRRNTRKKR